MAGGNHGYSPATGRPDVSGRPRARLAHWTAWPDAPFTRLSRAHSTTIQPVRGSRRAVRWAVFDPHVALVDGDWSLTTTNGSSAYASCSTAKGSSPPSPGAGRA